jgi:hypothetical protein
MASEKATIKELPRCVACGGYAPFFCDYEIAPGQTCDAPVCGRCRYNIGLKDYCPSHAAMATRVLVIDKE